MKFIPWGVAVAAIIIAVAQYIQKKELERQNTNLIKQLNEQTAAALALAGGR